MSERLTDEDLAQLEELEKISPSVWGMNISGYCGEPTYKITPQYTSAGGMSRSDAKLAVTARNALPALLAEVRVSRAEIAGLKADLAMAIGSIHAQDERERRAGERCEITYEWHGCDWPDAMAEEVIRLRDERDALKARLEKEDA